MLRPCLLVCAKRKTIIVIGCVIFLVCSASAQRVVNTTGATISNNQYIIEYSVGEIAITTLSSPGNTNFTTQGLLQPNIKIINPACSVVNDTIAGFPNPVEKVLSVVGRSDWITGYRIYAADGKLVRIANFVSNQINMSNLAGGAYFIKLYPGCDNKYRVLKVIKQ